MSRWRALAAVRDIPEAELRDRLVDATETLFHLADLLEVAPREHELYFALAELKGAANHDDEIADLQADLQTAEDRLLKLDAFEAERDSLEAERDALRAQLAAAKPLLDAYADAVSFARRFVSVGERAGIELKYCRPVPGRGKPANANAVRRTTRKKL